MPGRTIGVRSGGLEGGCERGAQPVLTRGSTQLRGRFSTRAIQYESLGSVSFFGNASASSGTSPGPPRR